MQTEMTDRAHPTAEQDQSAVAAVRGGDAERYRELVERHERRVFAVAWSRLGDAALAEEVTQEAFIRAYRRLWLLGDGAKFSGWVSTIARRVAINFGIRHRRELNKRERWALENFSETSPEKTADESEPLHTPETLRQTLAELPAAHRECLVLFYLEGKSGAEAATALGISESALRVRLHRARAAMRERLEEKLEGSLQKLRPSKTLIPAIMAAVLASSSAKAATGGSVAVGVGAKIISIASKTFLFSWLVPLLLMVMTLPNLIVMSFIMRKERENFRDADGFRPKLHRQSFRSFIWGFPLAVLTFAIINSSVLAAWGIKVHQIIITSFLVIVTLISLRSLTIARNAYHISMAAYCLILAAGLSALALGWLPPSLAQLPMLAATIVCFLFFKMRPTRLDYNLFLRSAHGLLKISSAPNSSSAGKNYDRQSLLAFARFLGGHFLVTNFRWETGGLALRLPPVRNRFLTNIASVFLPPIGRNCSHILLGWEGTVSVHCGKTDANDLSELKTSGLKTMRELESGVAEILVQAWQEFRSGNLPAAEQILGDSPESEVFLVPPTRAKSTLWMRIMLGIGIVLMAVGMIVPMFLPEHDSSQFKPVHLTEAQVRESLEIKARLKSQEEAFKYDDNQTPTFNWLLPSTNLMTAETLENLLAQFYGFSQFQNLNNHERVDHLLGTPDLQRGVAAGWITAEQLGLNREVMHSIITNASARQKNLWFNLEPSRVSAGQSGKLLNYTALMTEAIALKVRCLEKFECLDVLDKKTVADLIVRHQILTEKIPEGRNQQADVKMLHGLFFTTCSQPIRDTYSSLVILEKIGDLDRINREACIDGIMKFHKGGGLFTTTKQDPGLVFFGDARDTIAAFESLRILGGLDRVKDFNKWEFRPMFTSEKSAKSGHRVATWDEIEAWVCQQRLEKILRARKENPAARVRSLLEP